MFDLVADEAKYVDQNHARNWWVYDLQPCDDPVGFVTVEHYTMELAKVQGFANNYALQDWIEYVASALCAIAQNTCWEGDCKGGGPWVSVLPTGKVFEPNHVIITIKQYNNGSTFVASPVQLLHLAEPRS